MRLTLLFGATRWWLPSTGSGAGVVPENRQIAKDDDDDTRRDTKRVSPSFSSMEQSPLTHQPRPEVFQPKVVRLYEALFKVCFFSCTLSISLPPPPDGTFFFWWGEKVKEKAKQNGTKIG